MSNTTLPIICSPIHYSKDHPDSSFTNNHHASVDVDLPGQREQSPYTVTISECGADYQQAEQRLLMALKGFVYQLTDWIERNE